MIDINSPIVKEFLIESFENLSNINEEITQYENDSNNHELLNGIYRKVHTLKGSASFLGLKKLQEVSHVTEDILDKVREGEIKINSELIDLLLRSFDTCHAIVKEIETSGTEGNDTYSELLEQLNIAEKGGTVGNASKSENVVTAPIKGGVIPQVVKSEGIIQTINEEEVNQNIATTQDSSNVTNINSLRQKVDELKAEQVTKASEKTKVTVAQKSSAGGVADSVVRVNVSLLDKIMNVVGELVLNRNQILQYANVENSPELSRLAHQLNAITTELQTDIMTTRMQPVGSVLTKFERVVRDLSKQQGKNIKLTISGKDTELDKTLLEAIRDPLTHLIRNSVDHGIEIPEKRAENGKGDQGQIFIKSYHEGGQVTIEIQDDGNGIDPQRILDKAISKDLVSADKGKSLSKKQILNLIFTPGFSTAEQVTNISGRGVGMDVVKSNIEKIGGSVDVMSNVGEGTTFKLKIPLTLAIVPALVVESSEETFAIPQINLVELVRIEEDDDRRIETIHDSEFFRLRGDLIPVFRLGKSLKISECEEYECDKDLNIVILSAEGAVFGLIVDNVLDTEEIVVKPLSKELKDLSIYGGATIMGDGRVSLIVDALGFYNTVSAAANTKKLVADVTESRDDSDHVAYNDEILLCLLEDGREYGIPLAIVNRLEEFNYNDIEWSGDQPLVRYRGKAMPIIELEKILNISEDTVVKNKQEEIPIIVVNVRGVQLGFCVTEIRDIAINESSISTETVDRQGFLGTAFINDRTVTILDIFNIVDNLEFVNVEKECEAKGNVLIVEDSELFLRIQKELLKEHGYNVITAMDGKEALSKIDGSISAIVTDIDMPIMNGWELIKELRSSEEYKELPVLAVSSVVGKRKEEVLSAGFDFCFDKQNNEEAITILDKIVG